MDMDNSGYGYGLTKSSPTATWILRLGLDDGRVADALTHMPPTAARARADRAGVAFPVHLRGSDLPKKNEHPPARRTVTAYHGIKPLVTAK